MGQYVLGTVTAPWRGTIIRIAAIIAFVCIAGGCAAPAAQPESIEVTYISSDMKVPAGDDAPCIWIDDARKHESFYNTQVTREEALDWFSEGIETRLRARTRETTKIPDRGLLIELQKAYINPIDTNLGAVVVIRATWGERQSVYRGQVVQTNWWGAEREVGRTMSAALDEALLKINFPLVTSTCDAGISDTEQPIA